MDCLLERAEFELSGDFLSVSHLKTSGSSKKVEVPKVRRHDSGGRERAVACRGSGGRKASAGTMATLGGRHRGCVQDYLHRSCAIENSVGRGRYLARLISL